MEKLWTVQELAAFVDIPVKTVYRWRYVGYGPRGIRIGKHVRFRQEDVERWLDAVTSPDTEAA